MWNPLRKGRNLIITADNMLGVRYEKPGARKTKDLTLTSEDTGCVLADKPVPMSEATYYFEIKIIDTGNTSDISVGFINDLDKRHLNGKKLGTIFYSSVGYSGVDGKVLVEGVHATDYGETLNDKYVIGCGLDIARGYVFFYVNGAFAGIAAEIPLPFKTTYYPAVSLRSHGAEVLANFGTTAFKNFTLPKYEEEFNAALLTARNHPKMNSRDDSVKRGIDIVASWFGYQEQLATALPTRWGAGSEIMYKESTLTCIKYVNPEKSIAPFVDCSTTVQVLSDKPVPQHCDLFYFEVDIVNEGLIKCIAVGYGTRFDSLVSKHRHLGWQINAICYHGRDGELYAGNRYGERFGPTFGTGDTIGCGLDMARGCFFYTKNGSLVGDLIRFSPPLRLAMYCAVSMNEEGVVDANFGCKAWKFSLNQYLSTRPPRSMFPEKPRKFPKAKPMFSSYPIGLLEMVVDKALGVSLRTVSETVVESTAKFAETTLRHATARNKVCEISDKLFANFYTYLF